MNKFGLAIAGLVFIIVGLLTGVIVHLNESSSKATETLVKLKEGEELLKQTNKVSSRKALLLFNELSAQDLPKDLIFRVRFGQAVALEKNKDRLLALKSYKELVQINSIRQSEREQLEYRLGNLLLKLNQEEEGRAYLGNVLRASEDRELRSLCLTAIADYFYDQQKWDKAGENYSLALQEDRYNVHARVGLERSLKGLGKDVNYSDIFPENLDYLYTPEPVKTVPKKQTSTQESSSTGYFEKGRQYYLKKKYNFAITNFLRALKVTKSGLEKERTLYYLTECYIAIGRYDLALKYADWVLTNPNTSLDSAAVFKKGVIFFKMGKYKEAITFFNEVMEKYPESNPNIVSLSDKWRKEALQLLREESKFPTESESKSKDEDSEDE
jgi:tetratricopeptide (TPR) repeat protein